MQTKSTTIWTFGITSVALFMVTLDNLVVTSALPVIRHNLHASLSQLEWTVNAYTLTFAVLLLTGAALGDRFGRRLIFVVGILVFTAGSALAALSTSATALDLARGVQGVGGAIVTPLTLTLLSAAVPRERRGLALGAWGGIGGLAVAIGPLVGGAIVEGLSWQSIFLLIQFFQTVQGFSPLQAGLRILPWTAMPIFVAPIAGALSDRIGGQRIMGTGLALQAIGLGWIAAVASPAAPYTDFVAPFFVSGIGMALFFAPVANVVLGSVRPEEEGQASGAQNAIRELGGVFGVAVLSTIFASYGGYGTSQRFVDGLTPAIWIGAAIVAVGAL